MRSDAEPAAPRIAQDLAGGDGGELRTRRPELVFAGLGVSPGIAIGPAHTLDGSRAAIPDRELGPEEIADELLQLDIGIARARAQLARLRGQAARLPDAAQEEIGLLLDAHEQMLADSRLVREARRLVAHTRCCAATAMRSAGETVATAFAALDDSYLAARGRDVLEVAERVVRALLLSAPHSLANAPSESIIVATEVSPADTALMDPAKIAGFTATEGGAEGHTAIMARSLGIPAVLGVHGLIETVSEGDLLIVDGGGGRVIVNPAPETIETYRLRQEQQRQRTVQLGRLRLLPAVTRDGLRIALRANIDLAAELPAATASGAEGVGLLRTEFLFMNRETLPAEEEQFAMLAAVVRGFPGQTVTVRTLDLGGEKLAPALAARLGHASNPALGLRAIRLSLAEPELLDTQLRAILRAAALADPAVPLRVLLPMVTQPSELIAVRAALRRAMDALAAAGHELPPRPPPLGCMIEVPGAALAADALAQEADFFAIGTNDLTMYTLAIDRADEQVAALYNPLHPAVLRLVQFSVQAALRARIPVSVCGEMAGDARYTALLLGLGVTELSMASTAIPQVKQRIRAMDHSAATRRAMAIMDQIDAGRIRTLIDDFNALTG